MKPVVLLISKTYPPDYSGAGLRASRLARYLAREDLAEIHVLTGTQEDPAALDPPVFNLTIHRHPVTRRPILRKKSIWNLFQHALFYAQCARRVSQFFASFGRRNYIAHAFGSTPFNLAALAHAQRNLQPSILETTLLGGDDPQTMLHATRASGWRRRHIRRILDRTHLVVCLSARLKEACLAAGVEEERIWLRPNPVDGAMFHPRRVEAEAALWRSRHGIPQGAFLMTNVGRFCERKNQAFLVEALASVDPRGFLLLAGPKKGSSDESYVNYLGALARKHAVESRLKICAELRDDVPELLRAGDMFVFSSLAEGFPNSVAEALCCGLPVAAVDFCGSLADLVQSGDGILLPERSTAAQFAAEINRSMELPGDRVERGLRALARFDMARISQEYAAQYRRLQTGPLF